MEGPDMDLVDSVMGLVDPDMDLDPGTDLEWGRDLAMDLWGLGRDLVLGFMAAGLDSTVAGRGCMDRGSVDFMVMDRRSDRARGVGDG